MDLNELMLTEEIQLQKLHELVNNAIEEEHLLSAKLLEAEQELNITAGQKLADSIAEFGGSWTFIISFFFVIFVWIVSNVYLLGQNTFDPYPFILLNLILSCLAALQAPVIMMSQNRVEEKDRRRSRSDYMINLKAEIEVRNLHSKIDLLVTEQMKSLFEFQKKQLEILARIEHSISKKN